MKRYCKELDDINNITKEILVKCEELNKSIDEMVVDCDKIKKDLVKTIKCFDF